MRRHPNLSANEHEQIRALTLAHRSQREIADLLQVHIDTVKKAQKRLGVKPCFRRANERRIVNLLRKGVSYSVIARNIGCSTTFVWKISKERGLLHHPQPAVIRGDVAGFAKAILAGGIRITEAARKFGVGPRYQAFRLAHALTGVAQFRRGLVAPLTPLAQQSLTEHINGLADLLVNKYACPGATPEGLVHAALENSSFLRIAASDIHADVAGKLLSAVRERMPSAESARWIN